MTDFNIIDEIFEETMDQLSNAQIMNDDFPVDLVQDRMCDIASKWGVDLDEDFDLTDFIVHDLKEKGLISLERVLDTRNRWEIFIRLCGHVNIETL